MKWLIFYKLLYNSDGVKKQFVQFANKKILHKLISREKIP